MTLYTVINEGRHYDLEAEYITFSDNGGAILKMLGTEETIVAIIPPSALIINWESQINRQRQSQ